MKVIRVIVYDGPDEWLRRQIEKSLPDGGVSRSWLQSEGASIRITTIRDDRPRDLEHLRKLPPEALDLLLAAFDGDASALDLIQDAAAKGG